MAREMVELSIILPCRNEQEALGQCLAVISETIAEQGIKAEVIVSDSSTDDSPVIAEQFGARLVKHNLDGYGQAYREAFKVASGEHLFMADADATYDFSEIPRFLAALQVGNDFVIGNRFAGSIEKGAMPWLHRYVGNPLLSWLSRLFFRSRVRDVHCGMRAIRRSALQRLSLHTSGMEFASEMVIKAVKQKLRIVELPINYYRRRGRSKLKPLADGWRHLRFMLLYSPFFLFFLPGAFLFFAGVFGSAFLYFDRASFGGIHFFYHPLFLTISLVVIGYQLMIFALFAKTYAITHLGEQSVLMGKLHRFVTIEKASLVGFLLFVAGAAIYVYIFFKWSSAGYGPLQEVKRSLVALALIILGVQTIFSSFMLSILGIKEK